MTALTKNPEKSARTGRQPAGTMAAMQQMYVVSEHWLSDLQFYADELNFLRMLIDKYLMWLIEDKHIEDTRKMVGELKELENERKYIEGRIREHFRHLEELFENPFSHDEHKCINEHTELEERMAACMKKFRAIKRNVFRHTEEIMETEKATHLLKP